MIRHCVECDGSFDITRREYKTTHSDFDLFCTTACLLSRIFKGGPDEQIKTVPKPSWMRHQIGKRSSYEDIAERFFGTHGIKVAYEPFSIRLEDGRRYVPDFYSSEYGLLFEVKGLWGSGSKNKLSRVLDIIPTGSLILIPSYLIKQMEKRCQNHPVYPV